MKVLIKKSKKQPEMGFYADLTLSNLTEGKLLALKAMLERWDSPLQAEVSQLIDYEVQPFLNLNEAKY